jgi:tRNA modification GTPase
VVLAGKPNVGKSSLLNALAGDDIAIVTPVAGTTRDTVKSRISVKGLPVEIVDTAGLRETTDAVEAIGIDRTRAAIRDADLALVIVESTQDVPNELLAELPEALPRIIVRNKIDLSRESARVDDSGVWLSAKTADGVALLTDAIADAVGFNYREEGGFMARERHVTALRAALAHVDAAAAHLDHVALELFAEELRLAHEALGEITGEFTADDLLGEIFSRFCIGK